MILGIDSGKNLGFCLMNNNLKIVKSGELYTKSVSILNWLAMVENLEITLEKYFKKITEVYIEFPGLWGNSAKSYSSSAKGDTFMLAGLCGFLACFFKLKNKNIHVIFISPQQWKGQLPKDALKRRLKIRLKTLQTDLEHELDAIGIALWAITRVI